MSLRARLLVVTLALVALALTAAAWATHIALESFLVDRVDRELVDARIPATFTFGRRAGPSSLPADSLVRLQSADGRTLSVYFYMRIEECYGLHSVEITPAAGGIDVLVMTGLQPDAASRVCIEIAQLYVTTVTLDAPLIGNQY